MNKKFTKALTVTGAVLGATFVVMKKFAEKQYPKSVYED